jgi:hypothetical protein
MIYVVQGPKNISENTRSAKKSPSIILLESTK